MHQQQQLKIYFKVPQEVLEICKRGLVAVSGVLLAGRVEHVKEAQCGVEIGVGRRGSGTIHGGPVDGGEKRVREEGPPVRVP